MASSYFWQIPESVRFYFHHHPKTLETSLCKFMLLAPLLANHFGVRMTSMSSKLVEELKRFHPPSGFEPGTNTSEALAERYAGHQGGLFDPRQGFYQAQCHVIPSASLSMIVLSQIHYPGGNNGAPTQSYFQIN